MVFYLRSRSVMKSRTAFLTEKWPTFYHLRSNYITHHFLILYLTTFMKVILLSRNENMIIWMRKDVVFFYIFYIILEWFSRSVDCWISVFTNFVFYVWILVVVLIQSAIITIQHGSVVLFKSLLRRQPKIQPPTLQLK